MKKQLRIFLFAAMLVLLLGVTVLAVSAAGEWRLYADQTAADADTSNTAGTAYDTVAAAVSDIDTNGMVVKLTTDLTGQYENNATFGNTHTYTIDCDGHSIAYGNTGSTRYPFWKITAGNVTIKDLTLNRTTYSNSHITFSGTPTVVLENLVLTGADNCFGTISSAVNITIQGASTSFTNIDTFIAKLGNGSLGGLITIKDGTFCIGRTGNEGNKIGFLCGGAKIKIEGGTFTIANISNYTYASWKVDEVTKTSTANGFFIFGDNAWSSPVEITSGTFNLTGSGWLFDVPGSEQYNGLGNCSNTYAMGNDMIRISNGTFNMTGSSGLVRWRANYGTFARRDGSAITSPNQPTVTVTGGTFKSQTVTNGFFCIQNTQESNRCVINLAGGTFSGGKKWVQIGSYGTVNFCGADFTSDYPGGDTVNPGSDGFICSNNGGRYGFVNFTAGTVVNKNTENFIVRGSGVPVTVSGTADITTSAPFVKQLDNAYISPVHISGGTFTIKDSGTVVSAISDTASTFGQPCSFAGLGNDIIRISDGDFTIVNSGYIVYSYIHYGLRSIAEKPDGAISSGRPTITISGGSFTSSITGIMFYDQSTVVTASPIYNITGGTFGNTGRYVGANGSAIFNIGTYGDNSKPTFTSSTNCASGGVFHLQNNSGNYDGQLNFNGCTVNYTGSQQWIHGMGAIVTVRGGVFTINSQFLYTADPDVVSPLFISGGTFDVGRQIAYYNFPFAEGYSNRFPQVTAASYDRDDNVILLISGGTFNIRGTNEGAVIKGYFDGTAIKASGQLNTSLPVQLNITGGTFTNKTAIDGSATNTIVGFIYDVNVSRSRASADFVPIVYNVTGNASFTGHVWMDIRGENTYNIGTAEGAQPTFHCGTSFASGAYGYSNNRLLWLRNASIGGTLNIYGGTFTANNANTMMLNAAGAAVNISGGTFSMGGYGLCLQDGDRSSVLTITGGSFSSSTASPCVQFSAAENGGNADKGSVTITNGTFTGTTVVSYTTAQTAVGSLPFFHIEGGTFNGNIEHTASVHPMLITGGRFTSGSGFEACVPGRGYVGVTDDSTYKRVTAANLHGFAGTQMRLGTDLGVYFYVLKIDAVDSGTPSLIVSYEDETLATLTEYTTPANYPDGSAVESGYTLYRFAFNGLPPQRLGDDLDVVFKLTGVSKFANEFSGLRYCRQVRAENEGDDDLYAITGALLNFGAAAQTYAGYHTGSLVNATAADITGAGTFSAVSEEHAVYGGTLGTPHFVRTEENGVAARGVRFDTGIQLYARVIDTTGAVTCTYSVAGGAPVACEKVDLGGNRYAFYTGAITLDHFEDNVVFTLSTGETCTYSVQAFVYYYQDHATDDNGKALARALWAYKTAVVGASFNGWAGFDVADVVNP